MKVTIVDYNSGNISSVINSFEEVAKDKVNIEVTSDLGKIKSSDKLVLPGQGSFKSCIDALNKIDGLKEALNEFVINNKKPLLGICVGLQMFADVGYEETETNGLGWISGKVSKIDNQNGKFKLPHIGWNQINIVKESKIFKEWFQAFSQSAGITLHVENIYGDNSHHIIESCFKGLARSLRAALEIDPRNKKTIPSTKGSL